MDAHYPYADSSDENFDARKHCNLSARQGPNATMLEQAHHESGVAVSTHSLATQDVPASSDATLRGCIDRMVRQDQAALAELYDATVGRIHGLALRILKDPAAAEEVVSDVYLQAWRDAGRYDPCRGPVQGWLLVICRSRALDAVRRRDPAILHPDPHELANHAPAQSDLQDLLHATRSNTRVHEALAALQPLQRQILSLAFFRDYTYAEVAVHFGMPLGSVKTLIRGALREMRAMGSDWR